MALKDSNLFGIEELQKEFKKMEKKYPNKADALLKSEGRILNRRIKQLTRAETKKHTGNLLKNWKDRPVKVYKDGTVRVVRDENTAPHSHLIEYGHEIYRGTGRGRKVQLNKITRKQRKEMAKGNKTKAYNFLERAVNEERNHFENEVKKMFDDLIKDVEV